MPLHAKSAAWYGVPHEVSYEVSHVCCARTFLTLEGTEVILAQVTWLLLFEWAKVALMAMLLVTLLARDQSLAA